VGTHSPSGLSISYNGGKDCLVLLLLFLVALDRWSQPPRANTLPSSLQSVYIVPPHPFAEVDRFVDYSVRAHALDLARYTMPMRLAFETYLQERPLVKAILVGTRRTDPHGETLTSFVETDHEWPVFMRVHPVIDWHYAEIWAVSLAFLSLSSFDLYSGFLSIYIFLV
jgi:FAD synthetase